MNNRKRIDPRVEREIVCLTLDGLTAKVISQLCGVTERTVVRVRARNNVSVPNTGRPPSVQDSTWEAALELLEDGASYRDVAETFDIPRTTLREKLPGYGFTPEDTARLATTLIKLPERLRWGLVRNRKD